MARLLISSLLFCLCGLAWPSAANADDTGAIKVRVFFDRNTDGQFGPEDLLARKVGVRAWGPVSTMDQTGDDGEALLTNLAAGDYDVGSSYGSLCADYLSNNWLAVYILGFCTANDIPSTTVSVTSGETTPVELAVQGVQAHIGGRLWLDGEAAPEGTRVTARAGDIVCAEDTIASYNSYIGIKVSSFSLDFPATPVDPACDGEQIGLFAGERQFAEKTHEAIWGPSLMSWRFNTPFYSTSEYSDPGLSYAYFAWQGLGRASIRALVRDTVCGNRFAINSVVYGLTVLSDETKPGCGKAGDVVHFCLGDKLATNILTWDGTPPSFLPNGGGASNAPCPLPGVVGDADCDGTVTIADARLGLEHVAGVGGTPPTATCLADADSDCDHFAGIPDVLGTLRYLADVTSPGVGECPPVGEANY